MGAYYDQLSPWYPEADDRQLREEYELARAVEDGRWLRAAGRLYLGATGICSLTADEAYQINRCLEGSGLVIRWVGPGSRNWCVVTLDAAEPATEERTRGERR